nr:hypothetical protein [Streptomyces lincolnensis]
MAGGADHRLADRDDPAAVVVGDDQTVHVEATFTRVTQELGQGCLGFTVPGLPTPRTSRPPSSLTPVSIIAARDLTLDTGRAVRRVQVDVGDADVVQGAVAKRGERLVEPHRP